MSTFLGQEVDYSQGLPTPVSGLGQDGGSIIPGTWELDVFKSPDFRLFALASTTSLLVAFAGAYFKPKGGLDRAASFVYGGLSAAAAYGGIKAALQSPLHPVGRVLGGLGGAVSGALAYGALRWAIQK